MLPQESPHFGLVRTDESLEIAPALYDTALTIGFASAQRAGLTTPQAEFALGVALATKQLLDPVIRDVRLPGSSIIQETGGEADNPHRAIDLVGGHLLHLAIASRAPWLGFGGKLFIEEDGAWKRVGALPSTDIIHEHNPAPYVIIQDPCDGTSDIANGRLFVSTAVTVAGPDRNFVASTIASLLTKAVFVVDGTTPHLYNYTPENKLLQKVDVPKKDGRLPEILRIATLDTRMPALLAANIVQLKEWKMQSFGGHPVFLLLSNQIDALVDPIKGQPWYEALHWGWPLKQAGYWVRYITGDEINFPLLLQQSMTGQRMDRVPIIIARNVAIGNEILKRFRSLPLAV